MTRNRWFTDARRRRDIINRHRAAARRFEAWVDREMRAARDLNDAARVLAILLNSPYIVGPDGRLMLGKDRHRLSTIKLRVSTLMSTFFKFVKRGNPPPPSV
jgi:hypothetical protein